MLTRCTECSQVIEIATLNEHLLSECDKRTEFTQCGTCSVAVELSKYDLHITNCEGKCTILNYSKNNTTTTKKHTKQNYTYNYEY